MYKYLYIATEHHRRPKREDETQYSSFTRWIMTPSGFCKIGVTTQDIPAERLRKLLVGNSGTIELSHMWVGHPWSIDWLEQFVLGKNYSNRVREWIYADPKEIVEQVNIGIDQKQYTDVFPVPDEYLPYTASSYGECVFHKRGKDTTRIFNEAKELATTGKKLI